MLRLGVVKHLRASFLAATSSSNNLFFNANQHPLIVTNNRFVRHGIVPTSHPSGNLHAGRPTYSNGSTTTKYGLGRKSRKWRTRRKYKRLNNINNNRTSDARGLEQWQAYTIREHIGNLADNSTSEAGSYKFENTAALLLFRYFQKTVGEQKSTEELISMLSKPMNDKDTTINVIDERIKKYYLQQNNGVTSVHNMNVDPNRPMPRGFGNLSSSNTIAEFHAGPEAAENYLEDDENCWAPFSSENEQPLEGIKKEFVRKYEDVHRLMNTEPYWNMNVKDDTIWEINDNVTRKFFDDTIQDFVENLRTVKMDVQVVSEPAIQSMGVVYRNKDSVHQLRYAQVLVNIQAKKTVQVYSRHGKLIYGSPKTKIVTTTCIFEKPLSHETVFNRRWRLHKMDTQDSDSVKLDFDEKDTISTSAEESKNSEWRGQAKSYEQDLVSLADAMQIDPLSTADNKPLKTLHYNTNINFPEREDIRWVQAKKAQGQGQELGYDHKGSPLTTSGLGTLGVTEWKKMVKMWNMRSVGFRSGISGRGKGDKKLYAARMLRGSAGENLGLREKQYIGRKRIQVFLKRIHGQLSLPKPQQAYVAPPPTEPIGWNVDKQGKWAKAEPLAQFARVRQKSFKASHTMDSAFSRDLSLKDYEKYDNFSEAFTSKRFYTPSELDDMRKIQKE